MPRTSLRTLTGTVGNDVLTGDLHKENLFVNVGYGQDVLTGGNKNDMFKLSIDYRFVDRVDGGWGIDTVDYSHADRAVIVDLQSGLTSAMYYGEATPLPGGGYIEKSGYFTVTELRNVENVIGSVLDDTILGDARDNVIEGGGGADIINGRGGLDTVSYANSFEGVRVDLSGQDAGRLGYASGGHGTGDQLKSIENVIGSRYVDIMIGDRGANVFTGGGGTDIFVFNRAIGHDTITDFSEPGEYRDVLQFEGVFDDFNDLMAHAERRGHDVVITIDDHNSITLQGVRLSQLDAGDFVFA